MEKILNLNLKKEWYDMIESGVKKEEYREIKPYWEQRLLDVADMNEYGGVEHTFRHYDAVRFVYGYTKRNMTFEVKGITIGKGRYEWGAPDKDVFIIELGERIA